LSTLNKPYENYFYSAVLRTNIFDVVNGVTSGCRQAQDLQKRTDFSLTMVFLFYISYLIGTHLLSVGVIRKLKVKRKILLEYQSSASHGCGEYFKFLRNFVINPFVSNQSKCVEVRLANKFS